MFFIWSFSTKTKHVSENLQNLSEDDFIQQKPQVYGLRKWRKIFVFFIFPLTPQFSRKFFIFNGEQSVKLDGKFFEFFKKENVNLSKVWDFLQTNTKTLPTFFFSNFIQFWSKFLIVATVIISSILGYGIYTSPESFTKANEVTSTGKYTDNLASSNVSDIFEGNIDIYAVNKTSSESYYLALGESNNKVVFLTLDKTEYTDLSAKISKKLEGKKVSEITKDNAKVTEKISGKSLSLNSIPKTSDSKTADTILRESTKYLPNLNLSSTSYYLDSSLDLTNDIAKAKSNKDSVQKTDVNQLLTSLAMYSVGIILVSVIAIVLTNLYQNKKMKELFGEEITNLK